MRNFLSSAVDDEYANRSKAAVRRLIEMSKDAPAVGDLLKINYGDATVLIHDYAKNAVRGLPHGSFPHGSFLVATRLDLASQKPGVLLGGDGTEAIAEDEDACLVLLRIVGETSLPNAGDIDQYRFQAGMRTNNTPVTWDHQDKIDDWTLNMLRYGGYRCRVLGTLRMKLSEAGNYSLCFGADIVNFYSGRGMKVHKPVGNLLSAIVNYQRSVGDDDPLRKMRFRIGRVRLAASDIVVDDTHDNVEVKLTPADFIAHRTFYCGMSRGGKSNAMKVTAAAIYMLRGQDSERGRVGQLIFDPNGEYANLNPQDGGSIRNVWRRVPNVQYENEITTYGMHAHPNDPTRHIVKINFHGTDPRGRDAWTRREAVEAAMEQMLVGKTIIDDVISGAEEKYIKAFRDTTLEVPKQYDGRGDAVRYRRLVITYRAILHASGFVSPLNTPSIEGLFSQDLRNAMTRDTVQDADKQTMIANAAQVLGNARPSWDQLVEALKGLRLFITDQDSGYTQFNTQYQKNHDGCSWADENYKNILEIFKTPNGVRAFRHVAVQHDPRAARDYALDIVDDLRVGKLVIVDQSTGDPEMNTKAAERILWAIFRRQEDDFVTPRIGDDGRVTPPPPIMVYLEEAHNLLPAAGKADELKTVWARTAKEGSKYNIGMVLATQEPSSVMGAILKNTDNWFIAHVNNTDEARAISKFYDFADYADQIQQVNEVGFVRMRTLSNPYTVPVQIDLFRAPTED